MIAFPTHVSGKKTICLDQEILTLETQSNGEDTFLLVYLTKTQDSVLVAIQGKPNF